MRARCSGHFLPGASGDLALVLWEPPPSVAAQGGILHLPAAGDEMNKSRRAVALAARAFAQRGFTVALLDPRGTGDSTGDHGDATWNGWREDAATAWRWLDQNGHRPTVLWGLRLGALLALDVVARGAIAPGAFLLWQPVPSGASFFKQFFRLATAQQLTAGASAAGSSLRATLAAGSPVEVAGYRWHPELVHGAEAVDLALATPGAAAVLWREVVAGGAGEVTPAAARIAQAWRGSGAEVDVAAVSAPSFWATQEIAEAPALVDSSVQALAGFMRSRVVLS